jgi:hypothetical protein
MERTNKKYCGTISRVVSAFVMLIWKLLSYFSNFIFIYLYLRRYKPPLTCIDIYRYIRNSEYLVDLCSSVGKVHRVFTKEKSRWHGTTDAGLRGWVGR